MQKNKGQISIDLLITLVVAIIVIVSITAFFNNYSENQEKMLLQDQLDAETTKMSAFITSTQAMKGTNFTAKIPVEKATYRGETFSPEIEIKLDANKVILTENKSGDVLRSEANYYAPKEFRASIVEGYLVVTNE